MLSLFQLLHLQFVKSIRVFLNVVLLSHVPLNFQVNVVSLSIKMVIQIQRVSCDLFLLALK